jgi:hypothetical protein
MAFTGGLRILGCNWMVFCGEFVGGSRGKRGQLTPRFSASKNMPLFSNLFLVTF